MSVCHRLTPHCARWRKRRPPCAWPPACRRWRSRPRLLLPPPSKPCYGQGATESSDGTYHLRQGRYAILGLNAAWQIDSRAELRLNVNNALDKHYYQSIYSDVFGNLAGAPRNLMLTLNYKL